MNSIYDAQPTDTIPATPPNYRSENNPRNDVPNDQLRPPLPVSSGFASLLGGRSDTSFSNYPEPSGHPTTIVTGNKQNPGTDKQANNPPKNLSTSFGIAANGMLRSSSNAMKSMIFLGTASNNSKNTTIKRSMDDETRSNHSDESRTSSDMDNKNTNMMSSYYNRNDDSKPSINNSRYLSDTEEEP